MGQQKLLRLAETGLQDTAGTSRSHAPMESDAAADFIADLSRNLATTARSNDLPFLAHLLDMAHAEAMSILALRDQSKTTKNAARVHSKR